MKAIEWAKLFDSAPVEGTLEAVSLDTQMQRYIEETATLAKNRGGSVNAVEGAIREQRQKWRSICGLSQRCVPQMFEMMLEQYGQDLKTAEKAYADKMEFRKTGKMPGEESVEKLGEDAKKNGLAKAKRKPRKNEHVVIRPNKDVALA